MDKHAIWLLVMTLVGPGIATVAGTLALLGRVRLDERRRRLGPPAGLERRWPFGGGGS